jgi:hypothetical protein
MDALGCAWRLADIRTLNGVLLMSVATTVLHVRDHAPEEVEQALDAIFASEERRRVLRLEGTYSAVLARVAAPTLAAAYRYLICRPHPASPWTPLLELGNRTSGLDVELSRTLNGCDVFTTFVYDDGLSGYLCVRAGQEVDRYSSDPTYFADSYDQGAATDDAGAARTQAPQQAAQLEEIEQHRGHPERFADLLPAGTPPEGFAAVVLRPGWWEEHKGGGRETTEVDGDESDDGEEAEGMVDEADRMRCIGLALELWGPTTYPFAQAPEEIPNAVAGPAVVLAYA